MKLAVVSYLLIFSINFLAAVADASCQSIEDASPDPVVDLDGKNLQAGVKYLIIPIIRGRGGGVTVSTFTQNQTYCHRGAVQESFELQYGTPVTFTPVNPKKGVIRVSTDLNIKFSKKIDKSCRQSYVWKVELDELSGNYFVDTGGVEGNPGRETVSNWFKIEKSGTLTNVYKLHFCPNVCSVCKVICKDVGVTVPEEGRRLFLSDTPFEVVFRSPINEDEEQLKSVLSLSSDSIDK